jgi:hypothetical protein
MPKTPPRPEPTGPGNKPAGASAAAQTATGAGRPSAAAGGPPTVPGTFTSLTSTTTVTGGCGDRTALTFLDPLEGLEGIDPANLLTAGDAYYEGMLEYIGTFRAIDELVARFVGGLNLTSGNPILASPPEPGAELRSNLCNYMRQEPLRVAPEDRRPVLSLFGDKTLERLLLRLSDTVIAFDLSARPESTALTSSVLPVGAARLAFVAAIEDLELFLDARGGGGVCYITNEVGGQLMEILQILNDPDVRLRVPGNDVDDVFAVIDALLANKQGRPTDWEARQLARKASTGRAIFAAFADQITQASPLEVNPPGASIFSDDDLNTIGGLVYEWRAAHGGVYLDGVDDAGTNERADENRLQLLRLRRRAA